MTTGDKKIVALLSFIAGTQVILVALRVYALVHQLGIL